jgi:AraC-like DNA-binding protein
MDRQLIEILTEITPEEQAILNGNTEVAKSLYTSSPGFVVDVKKLVSTGSLITVRPHTRFVHFPCHSHNYIEIIYMCKGFTTHIINGNHRIALKEGELLFIGKNATQEILPAGIDDIAVNFIVMPPFFDRAFAMMDERNILADFIMGSLMEEGSPVNYLHFHTADVLPVRNLVENLIWSVSNKVNYRNSINQSTMGLIFLHLLSNIDKLSKEDDSGYEHNRTMEVLKYIDENYTTASLKDYASESGLPSWHLSRMITKHTGNTFKQLLQQRRLSQAMYYLRTTSMPVEEIISSVGYDNSSYFFRIFHEQCGLTPRKYRAKFRRTEGL